MSLSRPVGASLGREPRTEGAPAPVGSALSGAEAVRVPSARASERVVAGSRFFDASSGREATVLQKTIAFIGEAQTRLTELRRAGSGALVSEPNAGDDLSGSLEAFQAHWQRRVEASDGSLDQQASLGSENSARKRFALRGLDADSLGSASSETLQFRVRGQQSTNLQLVAGETLPTRTRRLDQTLAPLGLRAELDVDQRLKLSAPETQWASISDEVQVRGTGRIFPGGQFNRLRVEPNRDPSAPENWSVNGAAEVRETLRHATRLARSLDSASRVASDRLTALEGPENSTSGAQAVKLSADFLRQLESSDFKDSLALLSATRGLHRDSVLAVLGEAP